MSLRRAGRRWRGDHGSIAPAVPVIAVFLFLLAGLVVDSSRLLGARSRAVAFAEEAARAGGQQIDLNSDVVRLDPQAAEQAVQEFCAAARDGEPRLVQCQATTSTTTDVQVQTRVQIPTGVLGVIGVRTLTASGTGRARSQQGITGVDVYPSVPPPSRVVTRVPLPIPSGTANPSPTVVPLPLCPPSPSPSPSLSPSTVPPVPTGPPTLLPTGPPATATPPPVALPTPAATPTCVPPPVSP